MNGVMSKANKETIQTPAGLTIRRQGEALETISSKLGIFKLLGNNDNFEMTQIELKQDARLTLTPAGNTVETFFVLSGKLGCNLNEGQQVLVKGDYVVTEALSEPTTLTALSAASLLYITEQPQFHTFSEDLSQLRELAVEVELKDGYTSDHCRRIQDLSYALGQELGLGSGRLYLLDYGAYLHDVGKIRVPLSILNKPDKLTSEEWKVIKKHPLYGRELLDQTFMKKAGEIVEQHHERSDGSGYPYGLSGSEVLIEASIIAVADTFDAMTTNRPYRKASTQAEALAEIRKYAGVHYPKEVVEAFSHILKMRKVIGRG